MLKPLFIIPPNYKEPYKNTYEDTQENKSRKYFNKSAI